MPTLQQITPSLYQISLGVVNAFIIKDGDDDLTLVDTGYKGSLPRIFSAIKQGGYKPAAIKRMILTHAHPDHAGSAAAIKAELGIPLLAHQQEAPLLNEGHSGNSPISCSPGIINWLIFSLFIKRGASTIDPVHVDDRLNHLDMVPIAGGLQVIHTPGHSTGHIALLLKREGILIAGDLCANVAGLDLSTVYENRTLALKSILEVATFHFDKAVFGHGRPLKQQANQQLNAKFGPMYHRQNIL
ncbi:MBL fold metallo-hydrolase [Spirosoma sp.]|uniref:MBL fold metallo-hydrolase n=1 Tax=Spirosoma sp. TaxID=1899569 RepID=UPI00260EE35C|nr:MBL fold metallo-hydrolase [Spirosoma sp.]MCX6215993.1 MBL fold metallo-hydrolase [Spirosoma sp.]